MCRWVSAAFCFTGLIKKAGSRKTRFSVSFYAKPGMLLVQKSWSTSTISIHSQSSPSRKGLIMGIRDERIHSSLPFFQLLYTWTGTSTLLRRTASIFRHAEAQRGWPNEKTHPDVMPKPPRARAPARCLAGLCCGNSVGVAQFGCCGSLG